MARSEEKTHGEERASRNEVLFREANEKLEETWEELDVHGHTPFFCECGDPACTELICLELEEYERVRSHASWFLIAAGHDAQNALPAEEHGSYVIAEKFGVAGRIAEEEDPPK